MKRKSRGKKLLIQNYIKTCRASEETKPLQHGGCSPVAHSRLPERCPTGILVKSLNLLDCSCSSSPLSPPGMTKTSREKLISPACNCDLIVLVTAHSWGQSPALVLSVTLRMLRYSRQWLVPLLAGNRGQTWRYFTDKGHLFGLRQATPSGIKSDLLPVTKLFMLVLGPSSL